MNQSIFNFLEELGVKKISSRWVLRLLSLENKRNHMVDFEAVLVLLSVRRNSDEPLNRYIVVDGT